MNTNAAIILQLLTGVIIPIAIGWLKEVTWPSYYKFALAAGLSAIAAGLTAYINNDLTGQNILTDFVTIFTISQTVYQTFFRTLNLHAFLNPKDALLNQTTDLVAQEIGKIDIGTAKNVLDATKPEQIDVQVNITQAEG
jgi:hypothetical protein